MIRQDLFREKFTTLASHQMVRDAVKVDSGVAVPEGEVAIFRDRNEAIGLLIPISDHEFNSFKIDRKSAAIQFVKALQEDSNGVIRPFGKLILANTYYEKIFAIFVDELLSTFQKDSAQPSQKTSAMLQRWRRLFMGNNSVQKFDLNKQIGLLCELEVLKSLLDSGEPNVIDRWTGPTSLPHDFELSNKSIECKATTLLNSVQVSIHGASQLTEMPGKTLHLVVRRYIPNPDGEFSVPDLCDQILGHSIVPTEDFIAKVNQTGCPLYFSDFEIDFQRFDADLALEFKVGPNFPRINNKDMDTRISHLSYTLDLAGPELIDGFQSINQYLKESKKQ